MSLCGVLRGAGVDEADPGSWGQVEGGKFPAEGDADGRGVRHPADVGGRARHGDLFVGVFEEDREFAFVGRCGRTEIGTVSNGLGSG